LAESTLPFKKKHSLSQHWEDNSTKLKVYYINIRFLRRLLQSIAACRCTDLQNRFTAAQLRSVNSTICGNQTPANDLNDGSRTPEMDLQAFNTSHCLLISEKPGSEDCRCFRPCVERVYDTTVSASSPWPDPSFQQNIYERSINVSPYAYKFIPYEGIMEAYSNGSIDAVSKSRLQAAT